MRLLGGGLFLFDGESSRGDELSRRLDQVLQSFSHVSAASKESARGGTDLVDVRQNSSSSDGGSNERVELLVSSNGELQMTGSNTLDSEILGSVTYEPKTANE